MDYNKLINKNGAKILEVLQGKRLYVNQIHELTKIKSKNNLVKNLALLTSLNILKKEETKGNTFYTINYENFVAVTMLQLLNSIKLYLLPFERRKAIEETIKITKPLISVVFGSTAKGNFKKESDVDLLLVFKSKKPAPNASIKKVGSTYGVMMHTIFIEYDEFKEPNEAIQHMIKTGYPITGYHYFYEQYKKA